MSRKRYRKLTRYAVLAAITGALMLPQILFTQGVSLLLLLLWLWAFGQYQADVSFNPNLDATGRLRWRIGLGFTPYAIVVYWLRQVRGRRAFD